MTPEIGQADVFISHAHEDKGVARPLAEALRQRGLTVWYDEYVLRLGDSLREVIERGLATARFGVVILSPSFFANEWPQRELNALFARETSTRSKILLPVWHNLSLAEVTARTPILADRLAVSTAKGIPFIVEQILEVLEAEKPRSVAGSPPARPPREETPAPRKQPVPEKIPTRQDQQGTHSRLKRPAIAALSAGALLVLGVLFWRPWRSSGAPSLPSSTPLPITAPPIQLPLPAAAVAAVVRISGTKSGTPVRGSGFVVGLARDKATIVTASHVIEGVQQIQVTFGADPSESFTAGSVLGMYTDIPQDLAAFQVRGAIPPGVTTLSLEVESRPNQGDELYVVGFPEMAPRPRTSRRVLGDRSGTLLLIEQGIGEGFSGSPVLQGGKVVGVVTGSDDQTTYAVIALVARSFLKDWGGKLGGQRSTPVTNAATPANQSPPPVQKACVPGEELTENGITYIRICGGTFTMGSAADDYQAYSGEKPAHQVQLSEFWLGQTEVTNEQYRRFRPDQKGEANLPVTGVTWTDAQAACEHFGGRLPTEAEWEYAARAGSQTAWSFGNDEKTLGDYAWYDKNSVNTLHPIGTRTANAWGLHDMHGNVWEWVADWYGPYLSRAQTDPSGPPTGNDRVLRGGSFDFSSRFLRSAYRLKDEPEVRIWDIGFRCARGPRRQP